MPHVTATIGIPGSGKTTWAKEQVRTKPNTVIVSRDEIRAQLFGSLRDYKITNAREHMITTAEFGLAQIAIDAGNNVIFADTNIKPTTLNEIRKFAKDNNASFSIQDMFADNFCKEKGNSATLDEVGGLEIVLKRYLKRCHLWNLQRENSVPVEVVERMYKNYRSNVLKLVQRQHVHFVGGPEAIVVDIDGTMADMGNKRGPFEWKKVGLDDPIPTVIETVRLYKQAGYKVIVMSGRDAICRPETEQWLKDNGVKYDHLFMRPEGDQRPDNLIKEELFFDNVEGNFNVRIVLDDRDQVVDQWRAMGLKVYQVEPGDF